MSVRLNEPGIAALFRDPGVVAFVERTAEDVVEDIQERVSEYFRSAPRLAVEGDVDVDMNGSDAVIGIRDTHPESEDSKGRRIVRQGLLQGWMRETLDEHRI